MAKVGAKIFCFLGVEQSIGVKCGTRAEADEWLAEYPDDASVMAYIGRHGWNTLRTGGAIPDDELREAVDTSYGLVVAALPKRDRPSGLSADGRRGPHASVEWRRRPSRSCRLPPSPSTSPPGSGGSPSA